MTFSKSLLVAAACIAGADAFIPASSLPALRTARASSCLPVKMSDEGESEMMTRREMSLTYPAIISIPFFAIAAKLRSPGAEAPKAEPKKEAAPTPAPAAKPATPAPAAKAPTPAPKPATPAPAAKAPTPAPSTTTAPSTGVRIPVRE